MTVGERIKHYRELLNMTQEELGLRCGTTKQTIFKYESGIVTNIPLDRLEMIASALNLSPSLLMGWSESDPMLNILPLPAHKTVPRIGRIACGAPILAEEHLDGYDDVPAWIKCDYTLICKGDSMINARIFDGDIVCIKTDADVVNGDIAAVLVDNEEATLKRVERYEDHIVLKPENPTYRPLVFWEDDMNRVRIIGKATHFISTVR